MKKIKYWIREWLGKGPAEEYEIDIDKLVELRRSLPDERTPPPSFDDKDNIDDDDD